MASKVRLALVGCGGISAEHVAGYRALAEGGCGKFVVTACCDSRREAALEKAGLIASFRVAAPEVFDDPQQLRDASVADAADLCLPHFLHHAEGERFLRAGWHVLMEKPLGVTLRAGRRCAAAARSADRILAVAENTRRSSGARAAAWAIRDQRMAGRIIAGVVQFTTMMPPDYANPAWRWRGVKALAGGGLLFDSGHHFADMMLQLFGEPLTVSCTLSSRGRPLLEDLPVLGSAAADVEDAWCATMDFAHGTRISWTCSREAPGVNVNVGWYLGEEGTVASRGFALHPFEQGADLWLRTGEKVSAESLEERYLASLRTEERDRMFPHGCRTGFAAEVHDFVEAILRKGRPEIGADEGLRILALCESCYESAAAGRPVSYQEVLSGALASYQEPIDEKWDL